MLEQLNSDRGDGFRIGISGRSFQLSNPKLVRLADELDESLDAYAEVVGELDGTLTASLRLAEAGKTLSARIERVREVCSPTDAWATLLSTRMAELEASIDGGIDQRISQATRSEDLLPLLVESRREAVRDRLAPTLVNRLTTAYVSLAQRELPNTLDVAACGQYVHVAHESMLPEAFVEAVDRRFIELANVSANRSDIGVLTQVSNVLAKYDLDAGLARRVDRRILDLGAKAVRRMDDPDDLYRLIEVAARLRKGARLVDAASRRYLALARAVLATQDWLEHLAEYIEPFATARLPGPLREQLANELIAASVARARYGVDIEGLMRLLHTGGLTESHGLQVQARYAELARAAKTVREIRPFVAGARTMTPEHRDEIEQRYFRLLAAEAIETPEVAKELLRQQDSFDEHTVARVQAWLTVYCRELRELAAEYQDISSAVLARSCMKSSSSLQYRVADGSEAGWARDFASILESDLNGAAENLHMGLTFRLSSGLPAAFVIEVTPPEEEPGDCYGTVTLLDDGAETAFHTTYTRRCFSFKRGI